MNASLTPTAMRSLAIALLALLLVSVWWLLVQPIWNAVDSAREHRGIELRALRRDRSLLQEKPAIEAALDTVGQSPRWQNFYRTKTVDDATVQLQTDLRGLWQDSNNPTSMATQPVRSEGAATRICVHVTLVVRADQLADALDRLQKHVRQLRVDTLVIQAPEGQNPQANASLNVQADISALWLAPAARG